MKESSLLDEFLTERYIWNEDIKNYCLAKRNKFITPLQTLKLSSISKADLAESLQFIFFKRTGRIDYNIGHNEEYDIQLAKDMGVW